MTKDLPDCAMRQFLSVLSLLIALAATGCNQPAGSPKNARIDGDTYTNVFFQFAMKVPDGWTLAKGGTLRQTGKTGDEPNSGGDRKMETSSVSSDGRTYHLLAATEQPMGAAVKFNSSFSLLAEKISPFSSTRTGADYLDRVQKKLAVPGKTVTQTVAPHKTKFASHEFYRMDTTAEVNGLTIYHGFLAAIENGFALVIVVTSDTREGVDGIVAKMDSGPVTR
jgi:hypothetical protein